MWQKILVPVDASPIAKIIFQSALNIAKLTGSSLILLHVLSEEDEEAPNPIAFTAEYTRNRVTGEYDTRESLLEKREKQWEAFEKKRYAPLEAMKNEAEKQNVTTKIIQVFGSPGRTICEGAEREAVDLIVMGNRGVSGLEKLVLGSVSSYVVNRAFCSVLIARLTNKEVFKCEKILVAVEPSPIAKTVFDRALSLAKSSGSSLKILQVLSFNDLQALQTMKNEALAGMKKGGLEPINQALELMKNEALQLMENGDLKAIKNEAIEANVDAEIIQVFGNPGPSICEGAEREGVDLIVVGNRGLSGLQKMILGSVSNYVVDRATCSVLVSRNASE